MRWEHWEHDADVGIRGEGETLAKAYAAALEALAAVSVDPERVRERESRTIAAEGPDRELLLFALLGEAVFVLRRFVWRRAACEVEEKNGRWRARATLWGEPLDPARHQPAVEVKGPTMTRLSVREEGGRWIAECVVDV